ncbi:helix-turn-helix domain-containing protein [Vreelandella massiliensis]|uniref:helix-turn-helix transcriptional regulator n=1 Tax=Vreelandella massiliensis TaxID=1816686 RepID=UPI00096A336F
MKSGERLLPLPALQDKVGFKHTKIYVLIREGEFPPGKLIFGKRLWRESEIDAWIERVWKDASSDQIEDTSKKPQPEAPTETLPPPTPPNPESAWKSPPASTYWPSTYLCDRYGVSRATLKRWTKTRGFPEAVMPGGHGTPARWHVDDVMAWEALIRDNKEARK